MRGKGASEKGGQTGRADDAPPEEVFARLARQQDNPPVSYPTLYVLETETTTEIFGKEVPKTSPGDLLVEVRYGSSMTVEQVLTAAAAHFGLPIDDVRKALEEAQVKAARELTDRATAPPRLEGDAPRVAGAAASVRPAWPSETWKGSPEELSRKQGAIITYLRRVWKPFIDEYHAIVTRQILKELDYSAGRALEGYLRYNPWPADIPILTSAELRRRLGGPRILGKPLHTNDA